MAVARTNARLYTLNRNVRTLLENVWFSPNCPQRWTVAAHGARLVFRQPSGRHPRAASYVGHPASPDHIPRGHMTWRGGR